jgi:hypothetical protein
MSIVVNRIVIFCSDIDVEMAKWEKSINQFDDIQIGFLFLEIRFFFLIEFQVKIGFLFLEILFFLTKEKYRITHIAPLPKNEIGTRGKENSLPYLR